MDEGGLDALSRRGLRYACAVRADGAEAVARALYLFNRHALAPRMSATLGSPDALEEHLGLHDPQVAGLLATEWSSPHVSDGWITFHDAAPRRRAGVDGPTYKLYVSPRPRHVRPAVAAIVRELRDEARPAAFKVAADVWGLCRPDKLVVYFDDRDRLTAASVRLAPALAELPAQGVPFTAELAPGGILSWGVDPPAAARPGHSWRSWVTQRLARHVTAVPPEASSSEAASTALDALRRDGVDPLTWQPAGDVWTRETET